MSYLDFIYDLVSYVSTSRNDHRINKAVDSLKLRHTNACIDNLIFNSSRTGITRREATEYNTCDWIRARRSMIIVGATGTGKTYFADMLAISAITSGLKVYFNRMPILFSDLSLMSASDFNSFKNFLKKQDLIYIDDFALGKISPDVESRLVDIAEWYVENGDTRTLANLHVLQSKLNHPRQQLSLKSFHKQTFRSHSHEGSQIHSR